MESNDFHSFLSSEGRMGAAENQLDFRNQFETFSFQAEKKKANVTEMLMGKEKNFERSGAKMEPKKFTEVK